jgi:hypothetical protein
MTGGQLVRSQHLAFEAAAFIIHFRFKAGVPELLGEGGKALCLALLRPKRPRKTLGAAPLTLRFL